MLTSDISLFEQKSIVFRLSVNNQEGILSKGINTFPESEANETSVGLVLILAFASKPFPKSK